MKCIQYKNGKITRVSEKIANAKVVNGEAIYVSKTEWKTHIYGVGGKKTVVEKEPEPTKKISKAERQKEKKKKYHQAKKEMINTQRKGKNPQKQ